MEKMKAALRFLNILDSEGNVSITNLAVIIVLIKLAIAPAASLTEAGTLLVALGNYAHKRMVNQSNQVEAIDPLKIEVDEIKSKIDDMTSRVSALSIQSGLKRGNN